ncbi:hypothetical protein C2869_17625 [Saccharobesus litoralis]|uniref:Uncharacterized protein n=1 Tax=Saccharobesus litoralis TaxID=2172099 RepID=A0A2S0VV70_9ALTE|nr:hypothetical protein [Saccharobesus litoralis]AWB68124.1 hypothetical protein C2869_17625 [Saccharobesus litoralis]
MSRDNKEKTKSTDAKAKSTASSGKKQEGGVVRFFLKSVYWMITVGVILGIAYLALGVWETLSANM